MIDTIDAAILDILQSDGRTSNAEIARRVGMAPSAVFERVRKLEERGIVTGYSAHIAPEAVGLGLLAFVFVRVDEGVGAPTTESALADIPEVQEVHHIAGEDCFLVKVRARDTASLGHLLRERIGGIATVRSTKTTIVLETVKESAHLPIAAPAPEAQHAAD
ncbi:MAG TPA: Lrp/AsnC family transcriptional regulator [Gemmatimonadaceae bacterium]|nr:Lrp/AsnC family transcriptional regulator [Gemmatimonadaceae bacterium]